MGLTQAQIAAAHWDTSKPGLPLFRQLVKDRVAEAMKGRAEIQAAPDDTARAIQEQRHRSLEGRLKEIRLMGDALIAAFFAEDKPKAREKKRAEVESWLGGSAVAWDKLAVMAATLKQGAHPLTPFHWEIEFPEVFAGDNGGFDAIVGNPPYMGAKNVARSFGPSYAEFVGILTEAGTKNIDLVGHFFNRAFRCLRANAALGFIATKTIRQGDTREGSLYKILSAGGAILRAVTRTKWPGEANVTVSVVHIKKGAVSRATLDGRSVDRISAYLVAGSFDKSPHRLRSAQDVAFQGTIVLGKGFAFDHSEAAKGASASLAAMRELVEQSPKSAKRIKPFLGGEDLNNNPRHITERRVINLTDLTKHEAQQNWPEIWAVLDQFVRPERQKEKNRKYGTMYTEWWKYWRPRVELYEAIRDKKSIIAINCGASPHLALAFVPAAQIFAHSLVIFTYNRKLQFGILQSRIHEVWARFFASSLEDRLRYTPSDCFETFPLSPDSQSDANLEAIAATYYDHRAALMITRNQGMTKTYNRFHDPSETAEDIQRLRELHAAMDRAVLEAYGWRDLAARAAPVFLGETNEDDHTYQGRLFWPSDFRDEVLARLLALNAERHAEEVRFGIAPGMKGKAEAEDEEEGLEET